MSGESSQINEEKLHEFVGQMLSDLGGAFSIPLVRIGDTLLLSAKKPKQISRCVQERDFRPNLSKEWRVVQITVSQA